MLFGILIGRFALRAALRLFATYQSERVWLR